MVRTRRTDFSPLSKQKEKGEDKLAFSHQDNYLPFCLLLLLLLTQTEKQCCRVLPYFSLYTSACMDNTRFPGKIVISLRETKSRQSRYITIFQPSIRPPYTPLCNKCHPPPSTPTYQVLLPIGRIKTEKKSLHPTSRKRKKNSFQFFKISFWIGFRRH